MKGTKKEIIIQCVDLSGVTIGGTIKPYKHPDFSFYLQKEGFSQMTRKSKADIADKILAIVIRENLLFFSAICEK